MRWTNTNESTFIPATFFSFDVNNCSAFRFYLRHGRRVRVCVLRKLTRQFC